MFSACLFAIWLWFSTASAVDMPIYITTPSEVAAGSPFEASLTAEVHNGDASWCNAFRVYLGSSYEEKAHYFYNSDCYLIHEQTLCNPSIEIASDYVNYQNTSFTVTIPATVGPSGNHYVLIAQTFQTDGSWYGASLESDVFELTGANGTWGKVEKQGYTLWGDDGIACSGFACVKNCSDETIGQTGNGEGLNNTEYHACANTCPNVSIDFENSTQGGQPTASLTTPSPCPSQASASAIDAATTEGFTGVGAIPSATRSRSAAAAVGTSSASHRRGRQSLSLIVLTFSSANFLIG